MSGFLRIVKVYRIATQIDNGYLLASGDIITVDPLDGLIQAQANCEEKMAHKLR